MAHSWDPSVAADPNTGDFIAVAIGDGTATGGVQYTTLDPNYSTPRFKEWTRLTNEGRGADKPWIINGNQTDEFYVLWSTDKPTGSESDGFGYARTTDGGQTWTATTDMAIKVGSNRVLGGTVAQHTTNVSDPNAPLYIAHATTSSSYRFLKGVDDDSDPNNPRLTFSRIRGATAMGDGLSGDGPTGPYVQPPLTLPLNTHSLEAYTPSGMRVSHVPHLLADPTDDDRLFIIYQDTVDPDPVPPDPKDPNDCNDYDTDVFVRIITRVSYGPDEPDVWRIGDAVRVNQDVKDPNHPADQFTPAATVDTLGRLHVSFYDDRNYPTQHDEMNSPGPDFDVYYAIGTYDDPNEAWSWSETELSISPIPTNQPALDTGLWYDGTREYHGIFNYVDGDRDEILTAWTGTDPNEPGTFKGVIYTNEIPNE